MLQAHGKLGLADDTTACCSKRRLKTSIEGLVRPSASIRKIRTVPERVAIHDIRLSIDIERPFRMYDHSKGLHEVIELPH